MPNSPLIFIIDLDGTIIGDCKYQVLLYNIENILKENKIKFKKNFLLNASYGKDSKLIRPYFKYFIKKIKNKYNNALFYIYTASEEKWANKEISIIEKENNIKFNRPIFSRKYCVVDSNNNYRKSFDNIIKIINKNNKYEINNDNIFIIDNNDVFLDKRDRFIECPTYDYILYINILDIIKDIKSSSKEINEIINNLKENDEIYAGDINSNIIDITNIKLLEKYYKWLYKKYKKINKYNKQYIKDKFWKLLANKIIKNKS